MTCVCVQSQALNSQPMNAEIFRSLHVTRACSACCCYEMLTHRRRFVLLLQSSRFRCTLLARSYRPQCSSGPKRVFPSHILEDLEWCWKEERRKTGIVKKCHTQGSIKVTMNMQDTHVHTHTHDACSVLDTVHYSCQNMGDK